MFHSERFHDLENDGFTFSFRPKIQTKNEETGLWGFRQGRYLHFTMNGRMKIFKCFFVVVR